MPWSWLIGSVVRLVTEYLSNLRAEQALRDLGAAAQADSARTEAERQEAEASAAGEAAEAAEDDPRDLRTVL